MYPTAQDPHPSGSQRLTPRRVPHQRRGPTRSVPPVQLGLAGLGLELEAQRGRYPQSIPNSTPNQVLRPRAAAEIAEADFLARLATLETSLAMAKVARTQTPNLDLMEP